MRTKINNNKALVIFIYSAFVLFSFLLLLTFSVSYLSMAVFALAQLIITLLCFRFRSIKIISFPTIFFLFSFLFHFGEVTLLGLGLIDISDQFIANFIDFQAIFRAFHFSFFIQSALVIGIIAVSKNPPVAKKVDILNEGETLKRVIAIGKCFILLGIVPSLFVAYNSISAALNGGYIAVFNEGAVSGFISTVAMFFRFGLLFLIVGNKNKKKKARLMLLILLAYSLILMISGTRMIGVIFIIIAIYVYFTVVEKLKKRTALLLFALAYIGIGFLVFIREVRFWGINGVDDPLGRFFNAIFTSPLVELVSEMGGSLLSVGYSIMYFPEMASFNYGFSYVQSIITVFPNFGGFLDGFRNSFVFTSNFPSTFYNYLGGSYIGELYFNFGHTAYFFALIIGVVIGMIHNSQVSSKNNCDWIRFCVGIIIIFYFCGWVRDYFSSIVRDVIWMFIAIIVLTKSVASPVGKNKKVLQAISDYKEL